MRRTRSLRLQKLESEEMKQIRSLLSLRCVWVWLNSLGWAEVLAQAGGQASVIEGAKKEGRVVWYATLNISDSNALLHRFEQKYPFIKTELLRAGSEQLLNRILTQDSANRSALDLVNITTIN